MRQPETGGSGFAETVLDALPIPVFVVDPDVCIVSLNTASQEMLGVDRQPVIRKRGGEVLHCLHAADSPEGCGRGDYCRNCVIRNAVSLAFQGDRVVRRRARMELVESDVVRDAYFLVTTSRFGHEGRSHALLTLEDISELVALKEIVPICAKCKKIRNDQEFWCHMEAYFKTHLNLDFTHAICPDCLKELYPEFSAPKP